MLKIAIIGGGAAGFFGAIAAAECYPDCKVTIFEKSAKVLSKVKVSGGGRCNVTHACFDVQRLVNNYPRGGKELRGPFSRFQCKDTVEWFESRGIRLKAEEDGRMFPITDSSETIIDCLTTQAQQSGVDIQTRCPVRSIVREGNLWKITFGEVQELLVDRLLISAGSNAEMWDWITKLGHTIVPPVPSLFTFNVPDSSLLDLAGIAVPQAHVQIPSIKLDQTGPLLITHWGFSGPAVLKLSAWGARELHQLNYETTVQINWLPTDNKEQIKEVLLRTKAQEGAKGISTFCPVDLPKNLWKRFVSLSKIDSEQKWAILTKPQMESLLQHMLAGRFEMKGRTTYKEEFVTCGGVALNEVDFKTMESKICPGLYFAGEVLNIDGVTGGFNFQNAWTTSWIAGQSIGS